MISRDLSLITGGALTVFASLASAQSVRDSAGVRVVAYDARARPRALWSLTPRPVYALGDDGTPATLFASVRGITRLADGSVAVADGASNQIRLFSRDGELLRVIGRPGSGPGEFKRLTRLLRRGDTLVGVDADSRAHVFDVSGGMIRTLRPARRAGTRNPQRIGLGPGTTSYVLVTEGGSADERAGGLIAQTVTLADAAGDSLLPLLTLPSYRARPINGTPARRLLDAVGVVVATDSTVCAGFTDRLVITCTETGGRAWLRVSREVPTRPIREAERALVRQAYLAANRDAPPAVRQQMIRAVEAFPFASSAPAFSRLLLGPDRELWVGPFDPGLGLPGPPAALAPATPHTWSVLGPDGGWRAEVTLPARFLPFEVGRDYIAGVAFDAEDVEQIVIWGLRR